MASEHEPGPAPAGGTEYAAYLLIDDLLRLIRRPRGLRSWIVRDFELRSDEGVTRRGGSRGRVC